MPTIVTRRGVSSAAILAAVWGVWPGPAAAIDAACRARPTGVCVLEAAETAAQAVPPRITTRTFDKLAIAYARLGRLDQAVAATRRSVNPSESRLQAAVMLAEAGRFDEAVPMARGILEPETRMRALGQLSLHATRVGQAVLAGRIAQEALHVPDAPAYAMAALLMRFGRLDDALALADATADPTARADMLALLAYLLADDGQADAASRVARLIARLEAGPLALAAAAGAQARAGQDCRADQLFDEAQQALDALPAQTRAVPMSRAQAQAFVATAMAEARRFDRAEGLAGAIGARLERGVALAQIGTHAVQDGRRALGLRLFREAAATVLRIEDRALVLALVARAGEMEEAQLLAAAIAPVSDQVTAGIFQGSVSFALAQGRFDDAGRYIEAIPARFTAVRSAARVELIAALAHAGVRDRQIALVAQALERTTTELPEEGYRLQALVEIAHALIMAGQ